MADILPHRGQPKFPSVAMNLPTVSLTRMAIPRLAPSGFLRRHKGTWLVVFWFFNFFLAPAGRRGVVKERKIP